MSFKKIQLSLLFFVLILPCFTAKASSEVTIQKVATISIVGSDILLFHALIGGQLVGYMSCNVLPDNKVMIEEIYVDQYSFNEDIIKGFFASILLAVTRVKNISMYYPYACPEILPVIEDLGFIQTSEKWYELEITSRCKICEVLYGKIWNQENDSDSDWEGPFDEQFDEEQEALAIRQGQEQAG